MTRHLLLAAATVATLAFAAGSASAADNKVTLAIKTADLDLSSAAGRETARQRIDTYVKKACYEDVVRSRAKAKNEKCRAELTAKFDSQLTGVVAQAYPAQRQAGAAAQPNAVDQARPR